MYNVHNPRKFNVTTFISPYDDVDALQNDRIDALEQSTDVLNEEVAALQNQTSGTGSINTTGDITGGNVYGCNFNLNSVLNNFAANVIGVQDKFKLTVDEFGNLKIVPNLTINSSNYKATASVNVDGHWSVTGDDLQSCFYMYQLLATVIDPVEVANRRAISCGKFYNPADCLGAAYTKMKLMELEVQGKMPPVLLSLAKAIAQANNDAATLVQPQFQSSFVDMSVMDGMCCLLYTTNVYQLDGFFQINTQFFTQNWINYVAYQNNLWPNLGEFPPAPYMLDGIDLPPLGFGGLCTQNVGIPDSNAGAEAKSVLKSSLAKGDIKTFKATLAEELKKKATTKKSAADIKPKLNRSSMHESAFLKVGKSYLKDGNGVALGSSHWINIGDLEIQDVKMSVPKQNIEFSLTHLKTIPLLMNFNNAQLMANSNSNSLCDAMFFPYVALSGGPSAPTYIVGNTEYPVEFEGPVTLDWTPQTPLIYNYAADFFYASSQTGTLKLNIPRTQYGPIVGWDEVNNRAYCCPVKLDENYIGMVSKLFSELVFATTAEEYMLFTKKYGGAKYGIDTSVLDSQGNIYTYGAGTHSLLAYPKIYDNAANSLYNPQTPNDVSFANSSSYAEFWYNVVDGSDPDVYTSLVGTSNQWGQDNLGNVQGDIVVDTGIVSTVAQHSNTQIIDYTPDYVYNVKHAAVDIVFDPRQLLSLAGVLDGNQCPLELTRQEDYATYREMMNQISTYRPLSNKASDIYHCLYKNMGLISYDTDGAIVLSTLDLDQWRSPSNTYKLTTQQAMNLTFDRTSYNMKPIMKPLTDYLASYFASTGPNWSSEYLSAMLSEGIKFISAGEATTAVTQVVMQDAVQVLQNWDQTFNIESTGAHLINCLMFRVINRVSGFVDSQLNWMEENNTLTSGLAGDSAYYVDYWWNWKDNLLNLLAPAETKLNWWDALPNFTGALDGSDVWTKTRELTDDDRWNIFLKRLQYPSGFDAAGLLSVAVNASGSGLFSVPTSNGQLMQECFVAAILDIYQMYDTLTVGYCTPQGSVTPVTYQARVDTPAHNIADKIRLPWGAVHTSIYPYDWVDPYDPSSRFLQYALPYGADDLVGGMLTQLSKYPLLSTEAGDFVGALLDGFSVDPFTSYLNFPSISVLPDFAYFAASLQYGGQENALNDDNTIFTFSSNPYTPVWYRAGFVTNVGGSAFCSQNNFSLSGSGTVREVNQIGVNGTNSYTYRRSVYNLQNDNIPVFGANPALYSLSSKEEYNRTQMATKLVFKPAADEITY